MDIGGLTRLSRLRRALTPRGTVVLTGGEGGGKWFGMGRQLGIVTASLFLRQRVTMFIVTQRAADMATLGELIGAGRVTPVVGATYPLADVPEAVRHLAAGRARGKLAILV